MLLRYRRLIELLGRSGLISEQEGFPLVGGDSRLRRRRQLSPPFELSLQRIANADWLLVGLLEIVLALSLIHI